SLIMPTYDSYVLVADEAAFPALSRWCEEAPKASRLRIFVVADAAFAQALPPRENIEMMMGTAESVLEALATTPPTVAEYLWAAGEISLVRAVRGIAQEAGIPADQQHLNGYWRAGQENYDHHQPLDAE
ncbi:MAG: siderophore-interacting protein, partial [Propionibacteriaceae bacterium]